MKNNNKTSIYSKRFGLGSIFSLIYFAFALTVCLMAFLYRKSLIDFAKEYGLTFNIEKISVASIVIAISICVVTTLSLSLSIEGGNEKNFKFGLSPKRLNDYLDRPISLISSFLALAFSFIVLIAAIKAGQGPLFYASVLLCLGYYVLVVILALPILKGNPKSVFKRLSKELNASKTNKANEAFEILKNLYSRGETIDSIFESLAKYGSSITNEKAKAELLRALSEFVSDNDVHLRFLTVHWAYIKDFLMNISKNLEQCNQIDFNHREEWFNCLLSFYKKPEYKNSVIDCLYEISFGLYTGSQKNDNNLAFPEYIFFRFASFLMQNGDFLSIERIKTNICKNGMGMLSGEKSRLYYFTLTFMLFTYYVDKKVPQEYKNMIFDLKSKSGGEPRFDNASWVSIFNETFAYKFDIKRADFIKIVSEYEEWAEYAVFGKAYYPMMTMEKALEWYWTFLLFFNAANSLTDFIDSENEEESYYFEGYFNEITLNNLSLMESIISFVFNLKNVSEFFALDPDLVKEIDDHYNNRGIKQLNEDIKNYDVCDNAIVDDCKKRLENEAGLFETDEKDCKKSNGSFVFYTIYKRNFPESINLGCISMNFQSRAKFFLNKKRKIFPLRKSNPYFEAVFLNQCKRKKNIFINKAFADLYKRRLFPLSWQKYISKSSILKSNLFDRPTCFLSSRPYIGDFSIDVEIVPFSKQQIADFKKECDSGNGKYLFEGVYYDEANLLNAIDSSYRNLRITVNYKYSFTKSIDIVIDRFS